MFIYRFLISIAAIILSLTMFQSSARAAGQVRLELVGDARGAALSFQEWAQVLGGAGIKNVRLRSATEIDKVGIDVQGTADQPLYIVTGKVVSRDELQLPGMRFKRSEVKRLAQWLDDLAQNGPPEKRPKIVAFGLTSEQLDQVKKDLAAPVGFSTQNLVRREVVEKIARKLSLPLRLDDDAARTLGNDEVEDELSQLSYGTALGCLLRPAGYCLVPQAADRQIRYAIVKSRPDLKEFWPVGWLPEKPPQDILPDLFESTNVNVQNVSAATVLETIGKRLKTPVLYDRAALAKHNIDPAKATVNFPSARSNYNLALRKMLFPVGLRFEVRVDESGTAFLWISTLQPM